jgi:hypothetical protein
VARATVPETEDIALESLEEHHIVKWVLSELDKMEPADERFDAKVTVLIENVRHHVEEEEGEFFPMFRNELGRKALGDLGDALADAKAAAPTHPHPRAPDSGPATAVVGAIAGVIDRVQDNISGIAQGGVTAAQDLIARVLNNKRPKVSPTGTSLARTRATGVRRAASSATDGVEDTARNVRTGATRTAKAAVSGAKDTLTTAKKSARSTATTAKKSADATLSSARKSASDTANTAKKAASTTGRTAKTAAKTTANTAKRAAKKTAASAKG